MDNNSDPRLVPVYQQLQKSFRILKQCRMTWGETIQQCQVEIDCLQNLTEQYTCCEQADIGVLLVQVPDVREKLLYKISTEIDKKLTKLSNLVNTFQNIYERISKQYSYSLGFSKHLPLDIVTTTTEMIPAVSDMIEWLNDAETLLHHQYCLKKHLLESFNVQTFESNNFMNKWNSGNKEAAQQIDDTLCYVKFLIDDT